MSTTVPDWLTATGGLGEQEAPHEAVLSHGVLTAVRMPGAEIIQSARHPNQVRTRRAD